MSLIDDPDSGLGDRRRGRRLACNIDLVDSDSRVFKAENIDVHGIKYIGRSQPPSGPHRIALKLPSSGIEIRALARPVWARKRSTSEWEVGARLEPRDGDRLQLEMLVNAIDERFALEDLRFTAVDLLSRRHELESEVRAIESVVLPPIIERAVRSMAGVSPRPRYLWQYAYSAIPPTTLSSVDPGFREQLATLKVLAAILFTAIDDVADELADNELFSTVVAESFFDAARRRATRGARSQQAFLQSARAVWRLVRGAALRLPRGRELLRLLDFDALTLVHGMSHSLVTRGHPELISEDEQRMWTVASFYMTVFADLDLMCSPGLVVDELGLIRQVVAQAQEMCAIANWIGTWERELDTGDFSSGFFGVAIRKGIVTPGELSAAGAIDLAPRLRDSDVEASLLARWEVGWRRLDRARNRLESFDVGAYLAGVERFLQLQLASRGLL
jgi:hypothetical protein